MIRVTSPNRTGLLAFVPLPLSQSYPWAAAVLIDEWLRSANAMINMWHPMQRHQQWMKAGHLLDFQFLLRGTTLRSQSGHAANRSRLLRLDLSYQEGRAQGQLKQQHHVSVGWCVTYFTMDRKTQRMPPVGPRRHLRCRSWVAIGGRADVPNGRSKRH